MNKLIKMTFFDYPGAVYRGCAPEKFDDQTSVLLDPITHAVVLLTQEELNEINSTQEKSLFDFYSDLNINVIHFSMDVSRRAEKSKLLKLIIEIDQLAEKGKNVLIHCRMGICRTGLVIACLAAKVLKLQAKEAVEKFQQAVFPKRNFTVNLGGYYKLIDSFAQEEVILSISDVEEQRLKRCNCVIL